MRYPLEPSDIQWKCWAEQILEFMGTGDPFPGKIREGELHDILKILGQGIQEASPTNSGNFMAYVPGGGIPTAALATWLANTVNRFTGTEDHAKLLLGLENEVILWLCREFDLPNTAFGILTSGGSMANFTALVAARVHAFGESGDFSKACFYVSDQVHHSVIKAAFLAGLPKSNCIQISTDEHFKLSVKALKEQISKDRQAGQKPFLLVASAGTTNTGSIDPLEELAEFCRKEGLWFHVDAAYGGAFILCQSAKSKLKGIEMADSITIDPHKGLFLPYGTGGLLVRDKATLLQAYRYEAVYLKSSEENSPASLGPELCREYRGIRLWFPLKLHGIEAFRAALDEKLELTNWFYHELRGIKGLKLLLKPELTIMVFKPAEIISRVNSYGRVYLAPTQLRGEEVGRVCILSFRTHQEQVQTCLEDIQKAIRAL